MYYLDNITQKIVSESSIASTCRELGITPREAGFATLHLTYARHAEPDSIGSECRYCGAPTSDDQVQYVVLNTCMECTRLHC